MTEHSEPEDLIKPDIHSSSADYRRRFSGVAGKWFLDVQNSKTEELLKNCTNGSTVIDFGGGHGQNIDVCQRSGVNYCILGSDESCFELIKAEREINCPVLHTGCLTSSGLKERSFGIAMSYRMIPHLSDWQAHIKELCYVSDQSVIVEFANSGSVNAFSEILFCLKKSMEGNTRKFGLFSIKEIAGEFEKHGFRLADVKGQYLLPMVLHRALKNQAVSKFMEWFTGVILPRNKFGSPLICKFDRIE